MKKLILTLLLTVLSVTAAQAQDRMAIQPFFNDGIPHAPDAKVTAVSVTGNQLKSHGNLSIYRSVSVTGDSELIRKIERAVTRGGTKAESREVSLKDGRLYFGFYTMPPLGNENRYIFYLNSTLAGGSKATLIYLQGEASSAEIQRLIKR